MIEIMTLIVATALLALTVNRFLGAQAGGICGGLWLVLLAVIGTRQVAQGWRGIKTPASRGKVAQVTGYEYGERGGIVRINRQYVTPGAGAWWRRVGVGVTIIITVFGLVWWVLL